MEDKYKLTQIACVFTSDSSVSTADNTFSEVESFLINEYGDTRYTLRRGESLPFVIGYTDNYKELSLHNPPVITCDPMMEGIKMLDYSHRVVKRDNDYIYIDHHMYLITSITDNNLIHEVVISSSEYNLSSY